jgi:deoxycytidine triphosphate deaminase
MTRILSDTEIERLLGTVIVDGDKECIQANSYMLRLGGEGESFHNEKGLCRGKDNKALGIAPGHSTALTAYETINFKRDVVHAVFPGCELHAIVIPSTDFAWERIIAPTTQVDAGYRGALSWTIKNTSYFERKFSYQEKLFRLFIFVKSSSEVPNKIYGGGQFIDIVDRRLGEINNSIERALQGKAFELKTQWMASAALAMAAFAGFALTIMSSENAFEMVEKYGAIAGFFFILGGLTAIALSFRK